MGRGETQAAARALAKKETATQRHQRIMTAKLDAGEVIQMWHDGRGRLCWIANNTKAINQKLAQGFTHVETEERTVRVAITPDDKTTPAKKKSGSSKGGA